MAQKIFLEVVKDSLIKIISDKLKLLILITTNLIQ